MDFAGPLETHWTFADDARRTPERIAAIAQKHGLKLTHVVLDRGKRVSQPMFSRRRTGTLRFELAEAQAIAMRLANDGLHIERVKIEASLTNGDVPITDAEAMAHPHLYFEHHVRVPESGIASLERLRAIAEAHDAHLSRTGSGDDAGRFRFVTQRCYGVGRTTARARLDALLAALASEAIAVTSTQEELVVYDSNASLDAGWITTVKAPARERHPNAFRALASQGDARTKLFDPALKHFPDAFKHGPPAFASAAEEKAWRRARRCALDHVLRAIAASPWSTLLVLRGSVLLETWLGRAAREPGDLDWVVDPPTLTATSEDATEMLQAIVNVVRDAKPEAARVSAEDVSIDAIWTYERAEGRRLVFPWSADGVPPGAVQLDFVFEEPLASPAKPMDIVSAFGPAIRVRAATPELSLAWKILWLSTDMHPAGKDLYDAVLLAERFSVSRELLAKVLGTDFAPDSAMEWNVEWQHLVAEYPEIKGDADEWKARLVRALARPR